MRSNSGERKLCVQNLPNVQRTPRWRLVRQALRVLTQAPRGVENDLDDQPRDITVRVMIVPKR
jgi:hypothetical protein